MVYIRVFCIELHGIISTPSVELIDLLPCFLPAGHPMYGDDITVHSTLHDSPTFFGFLEEVSVCLYFHNLLTFDV